MRLAPIQGAGLAIADARHLEYDVLILASSWSRFCIRRSSDDREWLVQLAFYLIVLLLLAKPLGTYDIFACMADGRIDGRIVVNLQ